MMTVNWRSLHFKLAITVATAALVVVALSGYLFYQRTYKAAITDHEQAVEQLLATVEMTAAIAAYVGNAHLADDVVSGLIKNDSVSIAEIQHDKGSLARRSTGPHSNNGNWKTLTLIAPFSEADVIGSLRVQLNTDWMRERAQRAALANTSLLIGQMLAVAALIVLTVYWMLSRPLMVLSHRLHKIEPGSQERLKTVRRHQHDEIGMLVQDINGLLGTVESMLREERELRRQVEALEHRFRGIFEDSSAGIFLLNPYGNLLTANPAFFRLTGHSAQEQAELERRDCIPEVFLDADQVRGLIKQAQTSKRPCSADLRLAQHTDTEPKWVHCLFSPAHDDSKEQVVEGVLYDITARKLAEVATHEKAERDALTGLFNRQAVDSLSERLRLEAAQQQSGLIVMMVDLDRFKFINDTYGHDAGDVVLKTVADRLRRTVRDSDIVARLGGDEFLLLLPHTLQREAAQRIAGQLVRIIGEPIALPDGLTERIGVSIGIAVYPRHGTDLHLVRKHADAALYEVKRQGRNGYAIRNDDGSLTLQLFGGTLQ
ncbi:MAG: diguanylate cyclase domain-containing protein [Pseudomonadota bacterium]